MLLSFLIKTSKYSYLLCSAKHRKTIERCAVRVLIVEELFSDVITNNCHRPEAMSGFVTAL